MSSCNDSIVFRDSLDTLYNFADWNLDCAEKYNLECAECYRLLGTFLISTNEFSKGIEMIATAISWGHETTEVYHDLAYAYYLRGELRKAFSSLLQGLLINPFSSELLRLRELVRKELNNSDILHSLPPIEYRCFVDLHKTSREGVGNYNLQWKERTKVLKQGLGSQSEVTGK